tara:strand:- start:58 stop:786 length:729 start_codon:yes stop_codon:yes gene_type:complete
MKKALNIFYFLLSSSLLVFLFFTSQKNRGYMLCKAIEITVNTEDDLHFVNAQIIEELLLQMQDSIIGKSYEDINIYLLEDFVTEHPNIEKAELYLSLNGNLCVDVKQRKPIARVYEQNQSYYLDTGISPMPLSDEYSARVLLVYWNEITIERKEIVRSIFELIAKDAFLKAQITALEFDENDDIIMYPRLGDHKIILGEAQDLLKKFENLKLFYRQGLEKIGWDRYSSINLKFDNQVVCTKR